MSNVIASYSNMALVNTGKRGVLKELDGGYFELMLGAIGAVGNGGWVYDEKGCENYLRNNPDFLGRLKGGQLKMEWGHPVREPWMSDVQWMARVHNILESNTCGNIRAIHFTRNTIKDNSGRFVVGIVGEVAPWGKQAGEFRNMLLDPNGDVNASVRSFTDNNARTGRKVFTNVITWDQVTFPGIKETSKYNTPSMEANEFVTHELDKAEFDLVSTRIELMRAQADVVSMESRDHLLESIELMSMEHERLANLIGIKRERVPSTIGNW